ncbi:hypothetical protein [Sporosarcina ureilytica]|uniref:hypothetical protein n=1 Tax=Sporosarcina ureilytica TaxID=298596 RepID=UPI0012DB2B34|nr:hypothetical protein [Sporosarcina ureilytica]
MNTNEAEEVFAKEDRLVSTNIIFHDEEMISGVTVKTFSRFHKEKIEKELKKKLKEAYPEFDIIVSADNKIVHKTSKLIQDKDDKNLGKELKKLVSLLKEET